MSKSICIFGESGAGKTTSIRTLKPQETYYIDADKKGLSWRGWRKYYFSFLERKRTKELYQRTSHMRSPFNKFFGQAFF